MLDTQGQVDTCITYADNRSDVAEAGDGSDSDGTDSIGRSVRSGPTEHNTANIEAELSVDLMNTLNRYTYGPYP